MVCFSMNEDVDAWFLSKVWRAARSDERQHFFVGEGVVID